MFTITGQPGQIFLACGATDLRRGFTGLAGLIAQELGGEPLSGTLYVFCNRAHTSLKMFWYADGGAWVCARRLEHGTFRWPERGERTVAMTPETLQQLLQGLTPVPVPRPGRGGRDRWWTQAAAATALERPAPPR